LSPISQGLTLSAFGLSMAFVSMGLFILLIVSLKKIFPYKQDGQEMVEQPDPDSAMVVEQIDVEEENRIVAAIALAICQISTPRTSGLGSALENPPSPWWHAGRR
jgi:hypothetical protein